MRIVALGLLATLPGCNQVFGNDPVVRWDAGVPTDGLLPTARLSLMVATTTAAGVPGLAPELRPITPPPIVQVGRIGGALETATYHDGLVDMPRDFPGTPWRLVYQPIGEVPHEVHWAPAATVGHAVLTQIGGVDRAAVPANASYVLNPMGAAGNYEQPRVFTTGVWTETALGNPPPPGPTQTLAFSGPTVTTMSGPLLAPSGNKGDLALLVDYTTSGACRVAKASAAFHIELVGGPSMEAVPPSFGTNRTVTATVNGDTVLRRARVADALGIADGNLVTRHMRYGLAAANAMPTFMTELFPSPLPAPVMITLAECVNAGAATTPTFNVPLAPPAFPRIAHMQFSANHTVQPSGIVVRSGLMASITTPAPELVDLDFSVGIPTALTLDGHDLTASDGVMLGGDSPTVELTFALDLFTADYVTAIVHRVQGSSLIREREFTFTGTSLVIDRAVFTPQVVYVIEVRTFHGAPTAIDGDFTQHASIQAGAVVFTRSFTRP